MVKMEKLLSRQLLFLYRMHEINNCINLKIAAGILK